VNCAVTMKQRIPNLASTFKVRPCFVPCVYNTRVLCGVLQTRKRVRAYPRRYRWLPYETASERMTERARYRLAKLCRNYRV